MKQKTLAMLLILQLFLFGCSPKTTDTGNTVPTSNPAPASNANQPAQAQSDANNPAPTDPSSAPAAAGGQANAGLKLPSQMYFGAGGGGDEKCPQAKSTWDGSTPTLVSGGRQDLAGIRYPNPQLLDFCLFGFPTDQQFILTLTDPDGKQYKDIPKVDDRTDYAQIELFFPAYFPTGTWQYEAEVEGGQVLAKGDVTVDSFTQATLEVLDQSQTPFIGDNFSGSWPPNCRTVQVGEKVPLSGAGYEPNQQVPLGLYGGQDYGQNMDLVASSTESADADGLLSFDYSIDTAVTPGYYFLFAKTEPNDGEQMGPFTCFTVK